MKPPSLILWQRKIGDSSNINPDGRCGAFAIKTIRARPMKTPALQASVFPPSHPLFFFFPLFHQCDGCLEWGIMAGLRGLPAMGAVCYPGDGWPQWKPLGIPDTRLPLKRGSWFTGQSWRVLKCWYTGGDPEQRFQLCFADGLTRVKCHLLRRLGWPTIKNNAFWASDTCGSNSGQF